MYACFVQLLITGAAWAQGTNPRVPTVSLPYVVKETEENFVLSAGSYGDGFRFQVTHDNDKPIYCSAATLMAPIGVQASACANPVKVLGIKVPPLALGIGENRSYPAAGVVQDPLGYAELEAERKKLASLSSSGYEFCGPVSLNLECGFYCKGDRNFTQDPWVEKISGGSVEKRCGRDGNIFDVPGTVRCEAGYTLNPETRNSCLIVCPSDKDRDAATNTCVPRSCGTYRNGETWNESLPFDDGQKFMRCDSGNPVVDRVECLNEGDFNKVGNQCIRKTIEDKKLATSDLVTHECGALDNQKLLWAGDLVKASCKAGQVLVRAPIRRIPTSGAYSARFHMRVDYVYHDMPASNILLATVGLYSRTLGTIAERNIYVSDLKSIPLGARNLKGLGLNDTFPVSDSGIPTILPDQFRIVEVMGERTTFIPDLEARVIYHDAYRVFVGQIDFRFVPGIGKIEALLGCKDRNAANYNRFATVDDGSCASATPFLRKIDENAVYFQFQPAMYCHVQNDSQMAAYGGHGRVTITPEWRPKGSSTGRCGWPIGFYRKANEPAVYRVYQPFGPFSVGTQICHVTDEAQMFRFGGFGVVQVVSPDSDLHLGQQNTGSCAG
jgi:hypothetical protein